MTAESLEAAVFNAPREVQVQILKQLNDRYPDEAMVSTGNGSKQPVARQPQRRTDLVTPPFTLEEEAELLKRMETLDDTYTLEEIMAMVDETLANEDSR